MKRIDTVNSVVDKHGTGKSGFQNGTLVDESFLNSIQEEIAYPIEQSGQTLIKGNIYQLSDSLTKNTDFFYLDSSPIKTFKTGVPYFFNGWFYIIDNGTFATDNVFKSQDLFNWATIGPPVASAGGLFLAYSQSLNLFLYGTSKGIYTAAELPDGSMDSSFNLETLDGDLSPSTTTAWSGVYDAINGFFITTAVVNGVLEIQASPDGTNWDKRLRGNISSVVIAINSIGTIMIGNYRSTNGQDFIRSEIIIPQNNPQNNPFSSTISSVVYLERTSTWYAIARFDLSLIGDYKYQPVYSNDDGATWNAFYTPLINDHTEAGTYEINVYSDGYDVYMSGYRVRSANPETQAGAIAVSSTHISMIYDSGIFSQDINKIATGNGLSITNKGSIALRRNKY